MILRVKDRERMRPGAKSFAWELTPAGLLAVGATLLVATYLPIINPTLFRAIPGLSHRPVNVYVGDTAGALFVLTLAWQANLNALRARKEI
jgi:hypothetical protein